MLLRVCKAGYKWSRATLPALHVEGGHKDRVDGYRNIGVFVEKWGFKPHSQEYNTVLTGGCA